MIEVREVTKRYGNKEVLKQVSFEIKEKEIFALLGPNGSGKTTILECIEGLRKYDEVDQTYGTESRSSKGIVGIQLQSSSLRKHMCQRCHELILYVEGISPPI